MSVKRIAAALWLVTAAAGAETLIIVIPAEQPAVIVEPPQVADEQPPVAIEPPAMATESPAVAIELPGLPVKPQPAVSEPQPVAIEAPPVAAVTVPAVPAPATDAVRLRQQRLWSAAAIVAPTAAVPALAPDLDASAPAPPSLIERVFAADQPQPGSRSDPRWRAARDLLAADRPYSAALALLQLEASVSTPAPDTAVLLAQALYRYGTPLPAAAALARSRGSAADLQAEALLAAARVRFRQGDPTATLALLAAMPDAGRLAPPLQRQIALLRGLVALQRDDTGSAINALTQAQLDPQRLLSADPEQRLQDGIARYNLGVALLRAGQIDQGRQVLDRLGRGTADDAANRALRDRANVSLGWQFLRDGQGATARPIFERVALDGPYSNRALLGLGWAALAPQGAQQRRGTVAKTRIEERETPKFVLKAMKQRGMLDCQEYNLRSRAPTELCRRPPGFAQDEVPDEEAELIAKALLPWRSLQDRDPRDPAVRESWTALPHALVQLRRYAAAAPLYESAIAKLGIELAANEAAQALIASGALDQMLSAADGDALAEPLSTGSASTLAALSDALAINVGEPDRLLAALGELGDSQWLIATNDAANAVDPWLDAQLRARIQTIAGHLGSQLKAEHQALQAYLAAAHAGLAWLRDSGSR